VQKSRGNRTGRNFTLRVSEAQFELLRFLGWGSAGPAALGPWLLWRASDVTGGLPGRRCGSPAVSAVPVPAVGERIVLDLCAGTGAWSEPYRRAGYDVRRLTLPEFDVRALRVEDLALPRRPWGVLAAPPCEEFSVAKTVGERDFARGLECVVACLRIAAEAMPQWWAVENPGSGLLRRWMGRPRDVWQPHDFGDDHSKLTAVWGVFALPSRRHCRRRRAMPGRSAVERAITPGGFAQAFFDANP
jgi:hypothetical protein